MVRILIVDASGTLAETMRSLFQGPNRSIEIRDSISSAQDYLQYHGVDIVLLHPSRPGASSHPFARQVLDRNPHVQIIVCSNYITALPGQGAQFGQIERIQRRHCVEAELLHLANKGDTP